jgi:beta-glucosidase
MGKAAHDWPDSIVRNEYRSNFSERLAIDYKWFDQQGIEPRFPFGFGLSYTTFKLDRLSHKRVRRIDRQLTNERHIGVGGLYDVMASLPTVRS